MLKKTITFRNLDGDELTEDFYFNLSLDEITEMEVSVDGGLHDHMQDVLKRGDGRELFEMFKGLIAKAYGIRGDDGKRFVKSEEISQGFMQTDAYSELFLELATSADTAAEFFNGIIPTKAVERMAARQKQQGITSPDADDRPAWLKENRRPTQAELIAMPREELMLAMQHKNQ